MLLFVSSLLLLVTCKKDQQKKAMFSGNARLQGTIYFQDIVSGTVDTAKTAILKISKKGADTSAYYLVDLTNGKYDISSLSGGQYFFNVSYTVQLAGGATRLNYAQTFLVTVQDGQLDPDHDLKITTVTSSKPLFILKVVDVNQAPVDSARVSLYTDTLALREGQSNGAGSSRSTVTNAAGLAVFADMQNTRYYASVYSAVGSDTTSNWSKSTSKPYGPFAVNTVDTASVQILANKPTLTVTVVDQHNALISGAQVCLYSDLGLITQYKYLCTGSLRSTLTNASGTALFTNLQVLSYYISASKVVGTDTLYNRATIFMPNAVLKTNVLNQARVTIK